MAASPRFPGLLPKQTPTDVWSVREKLSLVCSVKRSGDNNWVSVSRAIKPYAETNRPADWFSQKNCALQYSDLLEKVETPRRKRGEKEREVIEAPGDVIVRKLTIERIEELKRIVQEEQKRYKKLKEDVEKTAAGHADDRIDSIIEEMEREKKEKEEAEKKWKEEMEAREQAKMKKRLLPGLKIKEEPDDSNQDSPTDSIYLLEEDSTPSVPTPQSASSQDAKPLFPTTPVTSKPVPADTPQTQPDSKQTPGVSTESAGHSTEDATVTKQEPEIIPAEDIKTEPEEVSISTAEVTIKEEIVELTDSLGAGDHKGLVPDDLESGKCPATFVAEETVVTVTTEASVAELSVADPTETSTPAVKDAPPDSERDVFVQVVDDAEDKSIDSASEGPGREEEAPLSPASSIMSNDTDGGSFRMARGDGRRNRGSRSSGGRKSTRRSSRRVVEEDKTKESECSSKAESSDDEACDTTMQESDDTASNTTGKLHQSTESVPNSPASIAPGDTEDEKAHKVWKKSIMLVWRAAANHKYANVFSHPVTEEIAPGYRSVVYRPLDLSSIKKMIETGQIRTTSEFQRDMMQMFTNAIMYNSSDHDVSRMATMMYDDVMRHIEQYVHTQIMVQSGEPKLLRPSRRLEVHSDKEDEPKRKRTSSDAQDGGKAKKRK